MTDPSTRARITALQASLNGLDKREYPPWDLGLIYLEVLDKVATEHSDYRLACDAQRPKQNRDRRATVQVGAMLAVLDQFVLLYPAPSPRAVRQNGPGWMDREW